ncbi:serine protease 3-like [Vanessa tameamea]|uniref:Serine protease 3-like n=1 Tax=Vanessa tameamea TaxID=334116 RepID=A0ABM4AQQ3_VANTA
MRHVNLQVITNNVCASTYGTSVIISSTICTSGAGNIGSCTGNSGGPLASGSGNNRQLLGVTSFVARAGCQRGLPAGFARVTKKSIRIPFQTGLHKALPRQIINQTAINQNYFDKRQISY